MYIILSAPMSIKVRLAMDINFYLMRTFNDSSMLISRVVFSLRK